MGVALENARLFDATRQQNAELAIVNEIGAALAKQLDFDAIIQLIGDASRTSSPRTRCSSRSLPDTAMIRSRSTCSTARR